MVRHEERVPDQSQAEQLRAALRAGAGGWKGVDAEELIKKSMQTDGSLLGLCQHRISDAEGPLALRVRGCGGKPTSEFYAYL
jgi:hypothetical protein